MTTALEEITVELTGEELPVHVVCYICYPVNVPFETYAMCGARLAGIDHPLNTPLTCEECADLLREPCPECGV